MVCGDVREELLMLSGSKVFVTYFRARLRSFLAFLLNTLSDEAVVSPPTDSSPSAALPNMPAVAH